MLQLVHVETVTQDYITNGLPHASLHDLHKGNDGCYGFRMYCIVGFLMRKKCFTNWYGLSRARIEK